MRGFRPSPARASTQPAELPPAYVLPTRRSRSSPYLYSASDIAKLMQAAARTGPPLRAVTYETLIGLLACTGLRRVGEAIRLRPR